MTDTTLEEAGRCPKCDMPGEHTETKPVSVPRGAKLLMYECKNPRCKWFDTPWPVQVNPDGTIPPPTLRREKKFPALDPTVASRVENALQSQFEAEQRDGTEVRNPYA